MIYGSTCCAALIMDRIFNLLIFDVSAFDEKVSWNYVSNFPKVTSNFDKIFNVLQHHEIAGIYSIPCVFCTQKSLCFTRVAFSLIYSCIERKVYKKFECSGIWCSCVSPVIYADNLLVIHVWENDICFFLSTHLWAFHIRYVAQGLCYRNSIT